MPRDQPADAVFAQVSFPRDACYLELGARRRNVRIEAGGRRSHQIDRNVSLRMVKLQRSYIAGMLPNSAENLERWIRFPQSVVPGNDMPNLGVTAQQARDITAYLYTLE